MEKHDNNPSILIIDDENYFRETIKNLLIDNNYRIIEAPDGKTGLDLFSRENPDLVLLDLIMPEISGLEILSKLTRSSPDTPVIVISGTGEINDVVEALRAGAWDFILKPIENLSLLLHAIKNGMERARLIRENFTYQTHLEEEVALRAQALFEREKKLRTVFIAASDIAFITADTSVQDPVISEFSPGAEKIFGFDRDEIIGDPISKLCTPGNLQNLHNILEKIKYNRKGFSEENIYVRKSGEEFPALISIHPIINSAGMMTEVIGVFIDVTERKKAETALRESEEKYRNLVDLSPDPIVILQDNQLKFINPAFTALTGYTKKDVQTLHVTDIVHGNDRDIVLKWYSHNISGKNIPVKDSINITAKNGDILTIEAATTVIQYGSCPAMLIILRDISRQRKVETEKNQLLAQLSDKNKELEQILFIASHDIRSPLVNIQGFSRELELNIRNIISIITDLNLPHDLKKKLLPVIDKEIPEALKFISSSITKIDTLISGLLKLSRLGRQALDKTSINMNELIAGVISSFEFVIKKMNARIQVENLPPCQGDDTQLNQVFSNLIGNALKYTRADQPPAIKIFDCSKNGRTIYCVQDNGIGIPEEHHGKIFEIFHRLNPAASEGEGLGLTIIQKIIELHGGTIKVESAEGKGSKFFVDLPM